MIVLLTAVLGACIGGFVAKKRGGKHLDILQYTVIYSIAFSMVGLFLSILVHRISL